MLPTEGHDMPNNYGVEITTQFIAEVDDPEWPHFLWRVTLVKDHVVANKLVIESYRMGLGHIQTPCGKPIQTHHRYRHEPCQHARCQGKSKPVAPDLYTVFCSLKADDTHGATFDQWCGDLGFDTDSRKAMDMYLACQKSEADSRRFFGEDWLRLVSDEDYQ
jgi:hypothetical protein